MLIIRDLKKSYGDQMLFSGANLSINYGERVALVGPNGAGKSTIFNIVMRNEVPDAGEVQRDEWTTVGYLPQEGEAAGDESVIEIATGRAGQLAELEAELSRMEATGDVTSPEYYEAHGKHDALVDPGFEAKAKKMLSGMSFKATDFDRPAKELSGGWVMRAHLARILAMEPDLLILDEPTNHLDLMTLLWLQTYLQNFSGAILMISHDREFMDEICQTIYEINNRQLFQYKGNYSAYLEQRQANYDRQMAAYNQQQKEIAHLQAFADRFRGTTSKASQAQSKLKQIERIELVEKPVAPRRPFRFQFPQPVRSGQLAIQLEDIHMAYGKHKVYEGVDLMIERENRTVLVGPNGAGKSTLLKILAGELEFQKGERKLGPSTRIGYFSQHRADSLDPENTVIEELMSTCTTLNEQEARGILGSFMFGKDDITKKTEVLSGGEKSRLNLVKFLVNPPNLLLMDEPTTHLDILTVESLIIAFERFEGALVFISHDVHFIRKLATKVLHINDGRLTPYFGDFDYYLEKSGAMGDARAALTSG